MYPLGRFEGRGVGTGPTADATGTVLGAAGATSGIGRAIATDRTVAGVTGRHTPDGRPVDPGPEALDPDVRRAVRDTCERFRIPSVVAS
jgi:hypothetical protein